MKRATVLVLGAVVCILLLCSLFFSAHKKKRSAHTMMAFYQNEESAHAHTVSQKDEHAQKLQQNEARIKQTIATLSARAQEGIVISDYAEFFEDLQNIVAFNAESAAHDIPLLTLVDKTHDLPSTYEPVGLVSLVKNNEFSINRNDLSLRPEAYDALCELARAALDDGIKLLVSSTYRSYSYQEKLFQRWVDIDGLEEAERESARAGKSQHQLGTAVDFGSITDDFAETTMGKWVYKNASTYGWSLSFPEGYEDVTGYRWECWHFRYIGKSACAFQKKYFSNVQQFMLEFVDAWERAVSSK